MTNLSPRTAQVHRPQSIDEQQQSIRTHRTILAAAADLINTGRAVSIGDLTASGWTGNEFAGRARTATRKPLQQSTGERPDRLVRVATARPWAHRRSTPGGDQCPHRDRW
ncbi:hypothetical protein [Rhodococcus sp. NPDC006774]|uniref:hypothetical protein n=1 Tax=Rhodococcus sp. NPDC006774 TaxID=3157186 RepID=UPI00340E9471